MLAAACAAAAALDPRPPSSTHRGSVKNLQSPPQAPGATGGSVLTAEHLERERLRGLPDMCEERLDSEHFDHTALTRCYKSVKMHFEVMGRVRWSMP